MAPDTLDVVRELALKGSTHFHASLVARQTGNSPAEAHRELEALRSDGILDVHFDVLCPETDRTIRSYGLGEEVPIGETLIDESGDCEPFEVTETSLLVTYSPSRKYLLDLNRAGGSRGLKKKRPILDQVQKIFSPPLRRTRSTRRRKSSMWSTS